MIPHQTEVPCGRCKQPFLCKAADIASCDCAKLSLSAGETVFIAGHYKGCLCNARLLELKKEYSLAG